MPGGALQRGPAGKDIGTIMARFVIFAVAVFTAAIAAAAVFNSHQAGAKDTALSHSELKQLITNAKTKADYERIAQYFDAEAANYDAQSKLHADLAQLYKKNPPPQPTKYPGSQQTFQHCDSLSRSLAQAAGNARSLAAEYRQMAKEAKQ